MLPPAHAVFDAYALLLALKANVIPATLLAVSLSNVVLLLVNLLWARKTARRSRRLHQAETRPYAGPVTAALGSRFRGDHADFRNSDNIPAEQR